MSTILKSRPDSAMYDLAAKVVHHLQASGYTAYFAGGCVRDLLLHLEPRDYDIVTNATPTEVERLFPGSETTGKSFAVTRAPICGEYFEVATFRKDHDYTDGRRPDSVTFSDPETDAQRRDFTINAMFLDPVTDELHDFAGGLADLQNRVIRCVGDPEKRFIEDHLRLLRAIRFSGTLGFNLEAATQDAIVQCAGLLEKVSAERIHDELTRILLESNKPGDSMVLMDQLGLLNVILPEVCAMKGQAQPPEFHPEGDVFTHTVIMLNLMKDPDTWLAYAVLFHDIGKPETAVVAPDRIRFNGHAAAGALAAEAILQRLKFSTEDNEIITHCVRNHMRFMDVQQMRRATLRKLVGAPTFPVELELHRLDCESSNGDLSNWRFLKDFQIQLANEPVLPPPWITGHDIIGMGVPQSRRVGQLHARAYDAQLEGGFKKRDELMEWLKNEIASER